MVDVNVIIVNYKMKESIREALTTLFSDIAGAPFSARVTVVDNASGDGAGEMLEAEFPQVLFLQNGVNLGFGAANNNAMKAVAARYYFFLNPDTRFVEPNTVKRLYEFMESKPRAGICAPRLMNSDGTLQQSCYRFPQVMVPLYRRTVLGQTGAARKNLNKFLMSDWEHDKRRMVDWVMGSAMFIRAAALGQIGHWDDRFFMYFEDTDLCRRFWLGHWPVYYLSDVVLEHEHHRESAKLPVVQGIFQSKTTRYHIASWLRYLGKYRGRTGL
jgi:GT2 family glycosyltransferase